MSYPTINQRLDKLWHTALDREWEPDRVYLDRRSLYNLVRDNEDYSISMDADGMVRMKPRAETHLTTEVPGYKWRDIPITVVVQQLPMSCLDYVSKEGVSTYTEEVEQLVRLSAIEADLWVHYLDDPDNTGNFYEREAAR